MFAAASNSSPFGNCPNGANGQNLATVNTPFEISDIGGKTINIDALINNNYLSKLPKDPKTKLNYKACIDTTNQNQLVLFSSEIENNEPVYVSSKFSNISPIIWDNFNRSDNIGSWGNATTGQAWNILSGTGSEIDTNEGRFSQGGTSLNTINGGKGDGTLSFTLVNNYAGNWGLAFRASNSNNFLFTGYSGSAGFQLFQVNSSAFTVLSTTNIATSNPSNVNVTIEFVGQSIRVKHNGVEVINYTDTSNFNITATQVGIFGLGSNNFYDNFLFY